jgi:hypothetical protein
MTSECSSVIAPVIGGALGGIAVIAMMILVVLHFRRRGGHHRLHVEEIDPDPRPFVSNGKHIYAI